MEIVVSKVEPLEMAKREKGAIGMDMSSVSTNCLTNLSSSLTSLHLTNCQLKGKFPDNIFHLPNLQILHVAYNYHLIGSLPTYNWSTPLESLAISETEFSIDLLI